MSLSDDARFDMAVADFELRAAGIIEPDEPTPYSHYLWMERWKREARGEFTADERQQIRALFGLGPFAEPQ